MAAIAQRRTLKRIKRFYSDIKGTEASSIALIAWDNNSGESSIRLWDESMDVMPDFNSTRHYVRLERSFRNQLANYPDLTEEFKSVFLDKMKLSANSILHFHPDRISLEVTSDQSLFYKLIKDDINIYIEHFVGFLFDEMDEAIATIYRGEQNIFEFGGTLDDVLNELNAVFATNYASTAELI